MSATTEAPDPSRPLPPTPTSGENGSPAVDSVDSPGSALAPTESGGSASSSAPNDGGDGAGEDDGAEVDPQVTAVLATLVGEYAWGSSPRERFVSRSVCTEPHTFRTHQRTLLLFSSHLLVSRDSKSMHPRQKVDLEMDLRTVLVRATEMDPATREKWEQKKKKEKEKSKGKGGSGADAAGSEGGVHKTDLGVEIVYPSDATDAKKATHVFYFETRAARDAWIEEVRGCILAAHCPSIEPPRALVDQVALTNRSLLPIYVSDGGATMHSAAFLGLESRVRQHLAGGEAASGVGPDGSDPVANASEGDLFGCTPLHLAVFAGHVHTADALIRGGASLDAADCMKMTPLHIAVLFERTDMVPLLCARECDTSLEDCGGRTPILLALAAGRYKELRSLCSVPSVRRGINRRDRAGKTPLMVAASSRDADAVLALLRAGAKVNMTSTDEFRRTALAWAAEAGADQCVRYLVEMGGAQVNARDANGDTALHLVPSVKIAGYLIGRGARMEIINNVQHAPKYFLSDPEYAGNPAAVQERINTCKSAFASAQDTGPLVHPRHAGEQGWVDDDASPQCMVCDFQFTMLKRRHHCRNCGILVCGACSTKKFRIPGNPRAAAELAAAEKELDMEQQLQRQQKQGGGGGGSGGGGGGGGFFASLKAGASPSNSAPSSPSSGGAAGLSSGRPMERVCDACFNHLAYLSWRVTPSEEPDAPPVSAAESSAAPGEAHARAEEKEREDLLEDESGRNRSAKEDWDAEMAAAERDNAAVKKASNDTASAQSAANDALRGLQERGEKLQDLGEKTSQMQRDAQNFEEMCRKLAEQEKKKSSWW